MKCWEGSFISAENLVTIPSSISFHPNPRGSIYWGRSQILPVARKTHDNTFPKITPQSRNTFEGLQVPNFCGFICWAWCQVLTIRRKAHTLYIMPVTFQSCKAFRGFHFPNLHGTILWTWCDEIEEELKPTLTLARNAANEFSELFLEKNIARYRELIKQKYAIKEKIKEEVPLKIESIPNDKAVSRDF